MQYFNLAKQELEQITGMIKSTLGFSSVSDTVRVGNTFQQASSVPVLRELDPCMHSILITPP